MRIVPFVNVYGWLDGEVDENPEHHTILNSFRLDYGPEKELDFIECVDGIKVSCPTQENKFKLGFCRIVKFL